MATDLEHDAWVDQVASGIAKRTVQAATSQHLNMNQEEGTDDDLIGELTSELAAALAETELYKQGWQALLLLPSVARLQEVYDAVGQLPARLKAEARTLIPSSLSNASDLFVRESSPIKERPSPAKAGPTGGGEGALFSRGGASSIPSALKANSELQPTAAPPPTPPAAGKGSEAKVRDLEQRLAQSEQALATQQQEAERKIREYREKLVQASSPTGEAGAAREAVSTKGKAVATTKVTPAPKAEPKRDQTPPKKGVGAAAAAASKPAKQLASNKAAPAAPAADKASAATSKAKPGAVVAGGKAGAQTGGSHGGGKAAASKGKGAKKEKEPPRDFVAEARSEAATESLAITQALAGELQRSEQSEGGVRQELTRLQGTLRTLFDTIGPSISNFHAMVDSPSRSP